jgi:hypothetical protein
VKKKPSFLLKNSISCSQTNHTHANQTGMQHVSLSNQKWSPLAWKRRTFI